MSVLQAFYLCVCGSQVSSQQFMPLYNSPAVLLVVIVLKLPCQQQQQTIPHGQWANALTKVLEAAG